jgi:hypothetical protein
MPLTLRIDVMGARKRDARKHVVFCSQVLEAPQACELAVDKQVIRWGQGDTIYSGSWMPEKFLAIGQKFFEEKSDKYRIYLIYLSFFPFFLLS